MNCLYCRKRIGFLRRLTDSEFCCPEHRVKLRAQSARALREQGAYSDDYEEISTVFVKPIDVLTSRRTTVDSSAGSTVLFTGLMALALIVGAFGFPESDRGSSGGATSGRPDGAFSGLRSRVRSYATVHVSDNFKSGLGSWVSLSSGSSRDWSYRDGFVRPAGLRLLKDSLSLTNYQVEFVGQVEQKGLGWVYRAKDSRNYYANKIVISRPGPLPRADLVRYALVGGSESARKQVPIPFTVRNDTLYKVQMTVRGADFTTLVNGTIVDTWTDSRLLSGGVGFFAEGGEVATLRYVTLTDRDNFVGRLLSYLGFFRMPLY